MSLANKKGCNTVTSIEVICFPQREARLNGTVLTEILINDVMEQLKTDLEIETQKLIPNSTTIPYPHAFIVQCLSFASQCLF